MFFPLPGLVRLWFQVQISVARTHGPVLKAQTLHQEIRPGTFSFFSLFFLSFSRPLVFISSAGQNWYSFQKLPVNKGLPFNSYSDEYFLVVIVFITKVVFTHYFKISKCLFLLITPLRSNPSCLLNIHQTFFSWLLACLRRLHLKTLYPTPYVKVDVLLLRVQFNLLCRCY